MKDITKARTIKAILEAAADIAHDLAAELENVADTTTAPAHIDQMVGGVMYCEPMLAQLSDLFDAVKALQNARVVS